MNERGDFLCSHPVANPIFLACNLQNHLLRLTLTSLLEPILDPCDHAVFESIYLSRDSKYGSWSPKIPLPSIHSVLFPELTKWAIDALSKQSLLKNSPYSKFLVYYLDLKWQEFFINGAGILLTSGRNFAIGECMNYSYEIIVTF